MTITFCGAAGEVTGSNFLVKTEKYQLLIDCGLFQGSRFAEKSNYAAFTYDPKAIDCMVLTHAHLDHCGRIPKLGKEGFSSKIFATPATRDLAELIMADAANIMLHDQEKEESDLEPLYLPVDASAVMRFFQPVEYKTRTEILPGVFIELYDAGHILGAASVLLEADGQTVLFSGDIGNRPVPILRDPEVPDHAGTVVMEATYGGRMHEGSKDRRAKLRQVIKQSVGSHGVLLIPSFALERTQQLLYELNGMMDDQTIPAVPIFLDSPLASAATKVYYNYERYYDEAALLIRRNGDDLFQFPTLKITQSVAQSKAIWTVEGPKVIIAGSGMMEGGRITHHAKNYLGDAGTTLLFIGYQGMGTLGRRLFDGERRVKIHGHPVEVKAHVVAIGAYSAHADQAGLIDWLGHIKSQPQHIYLVHCEPKEGEALAAKLTASDYKVTVPNLNQITTVGEK